MINDTFLQNIMKTEEEILNRMYETVSSFEYIELKAKLELLKKLKNDYINYLEESNGNK